MQKGWVPVVRSPLAIWIEMAEATPAAMEESGSSVEAAPAIVTTLC